MTVLPILFYVVGLPIALVYGYYYVQLMRTIDEHIKKEARYVKIYVENLILIHRILN